MCEFVRKGGNFSRLPQFLRRTQVNSKIEQLDVGWKYVNFIYGEMSHPGSLNWFLWFIVHNNPG
jgi:hypothetical protein